MLKLMRACVVEASLRECPTVPVKCDPPLGCVHLWQQCCLDRSVEAEKQNNASKTLSILFQENRRVPENVLTHYVDIF